jgi:hypothetical protein
VPKWPYVLRTAQQTAAAASSQHPAASSSPQPMQIPDFRHPPCSPCLVPLGVVVAAVAVAVAAMFDVPESVVSAGWLLACLLAWWLVARGPEPRARARSPERGARASWFLVSGLWSMAYVCVYGLWHLYGLCALCPMPHTMPWPRPRGPGGNPRRMGSHGVGMGLAWGWHGVDMGLAYG